MDDPALDSPEGLDLDALATVLDRRCPGLRRGPLRGELIFGGMSNLTYRVRDGESDWVVRRPPLGHVLETAHDMSREFRVLQCLHATIVPVARPVLLENDPQALGSPFYVMDYVPGRAMRASADLVALGPERTRRLCEDMVDLLAAIHSVDPESVGLGDFGRPEGFLERQVRRWTKQLDASRSRDIPSLDALAADLAAHIPQSGDVSIVHGDYRLDNLLVDESGAIVAVVDWEMATLGDPLADVGLLVVYQRLSGQGILVGDVTTAPGYPPEEELLARYAVTSGRNLAHLGFYIGLASFKLAVIAEGIHYRYTLGQTRGTGFERVGAMVGPLADAGRAALAG